MTRIETALKVFGVTAIVLVAAAAMPAAAAAGEQAPAEVAASADGCAAQAPTTPATSGPLCPAFATPAAEGTLLAKPPFFRTCRCSCGYPCTSDADCGGGRCTSGITCCRSPLPGADAAPTLFDERPAAEPGAVAS